MKERREGNGSQSVWERKKRQDGNAHVTWGDRNRAEPSRVNLKQGVCVRVTESVRAKAQSILFIPHSASEDKCHWPHYSFPHSAPCFPSIPSSCCIADGTDRLWSKMIGGDGRRDANGEQHSTAWRRGVRTEGRSLCHDDLFLWAWMLSPWCESGDLLGELWHWTISTSAGCKPLPAGPGVVCPALCTTSGAVVCDEAGGLS